MIEARLALNLIAFSEMPRIAWDALEAGLDGRAIRRLSALDSPTYFEVRDVLPRAMQEMGLATVSRNVAAFRIAKDLANEILERGVNPIEYVQVFERLWIDAGYPRELTSLGTLDDELYIANMSDGQSRTFVLDRLKEFIQLQEPR